MRTLININKGWKFIQKNIQPENFMNEKFKKVNLPHTWNNLDGQDGGSDYYRGTCWYYKNLGKIKKGENDVVYLEFKGVNSICDVYYNGKAICHHEGGFSTFRVRIDEEISEINELLVKVDNSANDYVYPQMADFTFFGGIYRDVNLIVTNKTHFDLDFFGGDGVAVTPVVEGKKAKVNVQAWVTNYKKEDINIDVFDAEGNVVYTKCLKKLEHKFEIKKPILWNGVKNPYLYKLVISILKDNYILDDKEIYFGIRSFSVDVNKGFILNGVETPLRGVSRHQDRFNKGWAISKKDHEEDMKLIKEMGANTIRLAHYQHDQYFYDLCDRNGMAIWAEIPWISNHMIKGNDNVVSQMKELVVQNYNHPSIFFWGLSNEISISGESEDLVQRHIELNEIVKSLDPTRLTTIANVSMLDVKSRLCQITDILSYNHYFGWYGGEYTDNEAWFDDYHKNYPERPIGISEYGCEAILTWHTSKPEQGDYSEEYQNLYHEHMAKIIYERPYLWATHVWNMFDFAADSRDEGGCQGRNNKGLVTYDRKTKKDTYYLYQTYMQGAPVLHITSKRYVKRPEEVTEVKVYSTEPEVQLYVNGQLQETKACDKVVTFEVKLEKKKTKIKVVAGNMVDNSVIVKVKEAYAGYIFSSKGETVKNWFGENGEKLDFTYNRDYFCIKDQIKHIMANPEGAALMEKFMSGMMSSMGDEVAGFKVTPAMMKMVQSFSIERISNMIKDKVSPELIYNINQELQKIKK